MMCTGHVFRPAFYARGKPREVLTVGGKMAVIIFYCPTKNTIFLVKSMCLQSFFRGSRTRHINFFVISPNTSC